MEQNKVDISNLDFSSIKGSLINFLQSQQEFSGYSFEGSSMNVLMDLLAYNTYYNGYYNNFVLNESFLDSATKRSSIVSLSKHVGYTPRSAKAAIAKVLLKIEAEDYSELSKTVQKNTQIVSENSENNSIYFTTTATRTFEPYELDSTGAVLTYAITDMELLQGVYNSYSSIISDPLTKISIPFNNIDLSTLRVFVLDSITNISSSPKEYTRSVNFNNASSESTTFWVQEGIGGFYEIQFGDGVLSKKLDPGNVVLLEFLITSGSMGNDVGKNDTIAFSSFSSENFLVETIQYSQGGSDRETLEEIRRNALLGFSTQDRAVTAKDYEAIILKSFGSVEAVRCWGGEENDPPEYGRVFATIKPKNAPFLSSNEKNNIIKTIISSNGIVGVDIKINDPDILYLNLNTNIKYNSSITNDSESFIKEIINNKILEYASLNYKGFDDDFLASEFIGKVLAFHPSIISVSVIPEMEKRVYPRVSIKEQISIEYGNIFSINKKVKSTAFYSIILEQDSYLEKLCFIYQTSITDNALYLYYYDNNNTPVLSTKVGDIDPNNGIITLSIKVSRFLDNIPYVAFLVIPEDTDVFTTKYTTLSFDTISSNRSINTTLTRI